MYQKKNLAYNAHYLMDERTIRENIFEYIEERHPFAGVPTEVVCNANNGRIRIKLR